MKLSNDIDDISVLYVEEKTEWVIPKEGEFHPYMRDDELEVIASVPVWKRYIRGGRIGNIIIFNPEK